MVLFFEHEKKTEPTRRRKWVTRILWILVVAGGMLWFGLTMIARQSGPDSAICRGVEDYFRGVYGGSARISQCRYASLYPYVGLDIAGLEIITDNATKISAAELLSVSSFWDVFFSRGKTHEVNVRNLAISSKDYKISFPHIKIDHATSSLVFDAASGGEKIKASLKLALSPGRGGRAAYALADSGSVDVSFSSGITAKGSLDMPHKGSVILDLAEISGGGHKIKAKTTLALRDKEGVMLSTAVQGGVLTDISFAIGTDETRATLQAASYNRQDHVMLRRMWKSVSAFLPKKASACFAPLFDVTEGNLKRERVLRADGTCGE